MLEAVEEEEVGRRTEVRDGGPARGRRLVRVREEVTVAAAATSESFVAGAGHEHIIARAAEEGGVAGAAMEGCSDGPRHSDRIGAAGGDNGLDIGDGDVVRPDSEIDLVEPGSAIDRHSGRVVTQCEGVVAGTARDRLDIEDG